MPVYAPGLRSSRLLQRNSSMLMYTPARLNGSPAKNFSAAVNVTGIMLAKLDGTTKGGVVLAIKNQLNIPVKFIGLGETPQDIETFDPQRFVDALFGDMAAQAAQTPR